MKSSLLTDMRTCPLSPVFALETQKHLGRVSFFPVQRAPVAAFVVPKDRGKTVTGLRKKKKNEEIFQIPNRCVYFMHFFPFFCLVFLGSLLTQQDALAQQQEEDQTG